MAGCRDGPELSSNHGHGSFRQRIGCHRVSCNHRARSGAVWVRSAAVYVRVPSVLLSSECDRVHWPLEMTVPSAVAVLKRDMHSMRILLILVDDHQGPFSVG